MEKKYTKIKKRVLFFAKNQSISIENFLNSIGMTYGSFKGKAKNGTLNSDAIVEIYTKYPKINLEWLLTGNGEMLRNVGNNTHVVQESSNQEGIKQDNGVLLLNTLLKGLQDKDIHLKDKQKIIESLERELEKILKKYSIKEPKQDVSDLEHGIQNELR